MSKPSQPARGYVSPVVLAKNILARADAGERVSKQAHSTARRIAALSVWVVLQLERDKAPYRVARWVAWGKSSEQGQRADLAQLLRRARPSKGWPDARHLKVAFEVYLQASRFGGPVSDVPVERYAAAIDAVPKRRRVAKQRPVTEERPASPVIVGEEDVLRALTATQRPRRPRPVAIKLRTTPLRIGGRLSGPPAVDIERVQAENARLRSLREEDEQEAERYRAMQRREIARLTVKIEQLERERAARAGEPPTWLVGFGGAVVGALAGKIVRSGAELIEAANARHKEGNTAPSPMDGEALFNRLLPVFDNLSRAQQHAEEGAPVAAIAEGLRMVRSQLDEALAQSSIERVPTVGHVFDPARHAAVDHVEAPEPAGVVLREVLPGYMAGDRLLRAPSVVVSRGPAG